MCIKGVPSAAFQPARFVDEELDHVLKAADEVVGKPRLRGEAYLIRYIDDFVMCFQYRADAVRVHEAVKKRLGL